MTPTLLTVRLVAAILVAGPVLALATDLPRAAQFEFIACLAGEQVSIAHGPNHVVGTAEILGTQRSNPSGALFDLTSSRCVYSYGYLAGNYEANGFCEFRDGQGDTYLLRINRPPGQAGVLDGVHGTGKYAGMSLRGEYDRSASFPDTPGHVNTCVKATGTFSFQ
jgi:hypothetical protein